MAKTKASVAAKVTSGKSSKARCTTGVISGSSSSGRISHRRFRIGGGGNRVCKREIPEWQKPITHFFSVLNKKSQVSDSDNNYVTISKPKSNKQRIINSHADDTTPGKEENQANNTLHEITNTVTGDVSVQDNNNNKPVKDKGVGKKSKATKLVHDLANLNENSSGSSGNEILSNKDENGEE